MDGLLVLLCLALAATGIIIGKLRVTAFLAREGLANGESWLASAAPAFWAIIPLGLAILLLRMNG